MGVRITAGQGLFVALEKVGNDPSGHVKRALRDGANMIQRMAYGMAPEHFGYLRSSIKVEETGTRGEPSFEVYVDQSTPAPDWGTRNGQPVVVGDYAEYMERKYGFMYRAYQRLKPRIVARAKRELATAAVRAFRSH